MSNISIKIIPQYTTNQVTVINCGTSSPRLGGIVDISAFPNLQEFRCNSNDITAISGYAGNNNLTVVQFFDNKVTGSIPSLSGLTNLQTFYCYTNQLTGPIPSLSGLTNLRNFSCSNQTGSTKLTGPIPSLSGLTNLQTFYCHLNQLTGFDGGSVSNTLGDFQAQSNQLTSTAVNDILAAFVTANRTTGSRILNLGGSGNAAPTGQGITDKATLISRGWTVTTN